MTKAKRQPAQHDPAEGAPAAVSFAVDPHSQPRLSEDGKDPGPAAGLPPPEAAPGMVPLGWTPEEIEAQLSALWFLGMVVYSVAKWQKPGFAIQLAARKGEFGPSSAALVPAFDAYVPKSIGGPAGIGFAGIAVMGDVIRATQAREAALRHGPPAEPAPATGTGPTPRPASSPPPPPPSGADGGGSGYRFPKDLESNIPPAEPPYVGMGYE